MILKIDFIHLAFIFLSAIGSHRPLVQAFLICRVAFTFFSSYTCKVSITAVAKLLQHGVNTNDSRLTEITVRGDQVFFKICDSTFNAILCQVFSEGRATRSSKKVEQWTEVPLLAKLLKLLVNEMQNCVEEAENGAEDSSDEEEGWDDDSQDSQEEESGGAALTLDLSR